MQLSHGLDDRPVVPNRETKSSGSENTYDTDISDLDTVRREIAEMASDAAAWLERRELLARTVVIKVRYADFTTITRSHSASATRAAESIVARALDLLTRTEAGHRPVRLLGVSVHNLQDHPDEPETPPRLPFEDSAEGPADC